ncbi:unnamed protein product [Rotaria sp. Silwood1]|nr:unnamed protein product [Rotaria sp. Silwood1]CAF1673707.1 unnamed protein product [Rotaria sp. Silwood1]CAF3443392.1 unnamed protein product [Rotaria sp. Silwood1]CAF3825116.1 unnamed protein product [Rotaria sp. Silwood1]CAF3862546.1 unnamed protein product [Rotaria sp. Silwood1]
METTESRLVKFGILISLQPPSIICYLASIHYIVSNRRAREALHNHGPLVLLFVGLFTVIFDLSMILDFLRTGVVTPSTYSYCRMWAFFDMLLYALVCILMLWISIERHILIFHQRQWLDTERKRYFVHYLPLILIFGYLTAFYIYGGFIYPCENNFDYHVVLCGSLCFAFADPVLGLYDQFVNSLIPILLIVIVNLGLWIRIVWQKYYRVRQAMEWRQHRKMIVQFVPVAVLYMSGYLTYGFLQCYHMIHGPTDLSTFIQQVYFFHLFYLVGLLHPFVCLIGMPEVYRKWLPKRDRHITPTALNLNNRMTKLMITRF